MSLTPETREDPNKQTMLTLLAAAVLIMLIPVFGAVYMRWSSQPPAAISTGEVSPTVRFKAGDVFATPSDDGTYYLIGKIVVLEEDQFHVRVYGSRFKTVPKSVDTSKLKVSATHVALAAPDMVTWKPVFIQHEAVSDAELEGYRVYLEAIIKAEDDK